MKIVKLKNINELAQDFIKSPRIHIIKDVLSITYDYELDSGGYGEKSIYFNECFIYRRTNEKNVTADMLAANNSIGEVVDSNLLTKEMLTDGFKHYIIYFDEFGAYEIVAKDFQSPTIDASKNV